MRAMATRGGAVHVATTTRRYKGKVYRTTLLRRTFRDGGKVKHETVGNLSHLPPDVIDLIRQRLRSGLSSAVATGDFEILRSLPHGHVAAVLGTLRSIGLDSVLASQSSRERSLVIAMIVARVIDARSKLATVRGLREAAAISSLGLELGLGEPSERELYAAMDWLLERQSRIEGKLAKCHLEDGSLVLYDVSSSFYTGTHCALAKFGHNRDGNNGYPQIVYGLLCNAAGCPVAVEVFEGNTGDPKTLGSQITKVRKRFGIQRVVFVGDRGMITNRRIDENFREIEGLDWITALRADSIRKLAQQGVFQPSLFDQRNLAEISSPDYPGERLIVCRNPLLADERARKREELLQATEKQLEEIVAATRRTRRSLHGKDAIGLRVGKVINHYKVGKHFLLEIAEDSFEFRRDDAAIRSEASLDGLYVIRTSVSTEILSAESVVSSYKDLSKVERAFRSLKTVDLKVRPIYHRLADRVRAHVFLCMLAYYVEWHMRERLLPILFDDHDREGAKEQRDSIVAPAQRSPGAHTKDLTKRTEDGLEVQSFRTLIAHLGTLAKNLVRTSRVPEFYLLTRPTTLQRRAFDLLSVSL